MKNYLQDFYKGKNILVTGHTGFKGSWLSIWLHQMGANIIGLGLEPYSEKDNFVLSQIGQKITDIRGDIRDSSLVKSVFNRYKPDMVFHLAAQPLVRLSYDEPVSTYETNVMGTIHIMEAMRITPETKVAIMITTDKCYENKEQLWGYRENDPMGGYDPYSSSKGCAELAISSWRRSFFAPEHYNEHGKAIASVRAGNVIGGGDWAKDRIVPDCIRALEQNKAIEIRNPKAIRPWQHVLEPLYGYMLLGKKLWEHPTEYCEGWNFGPKLESVSTVWEVAEKITNQYQRGELKDCSNPKALHEANLLMLDITKAYLKLGWEPHLNISETIEFTVDWYMRYMTENVYDLCVEQINRYTEKL